jgi:Ser/Thr protein kinase RdoA (MazF antagonist)
MAIERVLPDVPAREATVVRAGLTAARVVLERAWRGGPGGPVVMVHGDVHAHNVLETAREGDDVALALIDVGQVGLAPVLLDLAFALLEHRDATAWALWRGYRTRRAVPPDAEAALGAMHVLALVDNLGFLAADEREHAFVGEAWPALVASCAALLSGARAA